MFPSAPVVRWNGCTLAIGIGYSTKNCAFAVSVLEGRLIRRAKTRRERATDVELARDILR
jgi:hypothetical protein